MKTITDKGVKFLLKDARSDRPTLIYLVFRYDNGRFKTSTGQTIIPYLWDSDKQRARTDIKNKQERQTNETINAHLERQRSALLKVLNSLQLAQIPFNNETIKQHLDNALERTKKTKIETAKVETLPNYIERFVQEAQSGKRLNSKSVRYAKYTLDGYMKLKRILERYQLETGNGVTFDSFTLDYYHHFKLWLTGRGLTLNYVGTLLKDLKVMLKQSHADGMHSNTVYQHRDFKKLVEDVDNVYLSDEELTRLFTLDLSHNARLDRIRDLFLIGAYTGLRFSDFSELRPENITHNGRILTRKTLKTSERVSIPLNPNVLAILAKYEGVPPQTISNQKMNDYVKELCQRAGLTERIEVSRTKGGLKQTRYLEKWELVTTHTARRSFATNAFLAKVPTVSIMKITGHKSEAVFLRYIKISSEQNALLMLEHPHFAGTL
ncbi:site-specific recombinase XerD [Larkinella arboricola]|uniref:Site-specific recombinase XerD n=1 Tax=Larkinella arboricola TaxID=643671 RepID=A0A327WVE7_LARAB|nr:site-specific integrase [Larkinella arboricola]RAJ95425.1 site-specific recombinase XerD [Larkinella arboricola]